MISEDTDENDKPVSEKVKTKKNLKGGSPNNNNATQENIHIKHGFSYN